MELLVVTTFGCLLVTTTTTVSFSFSDAVAVVIQRVARSRRRENECNARQRVQLFTAQASGRIATSTCCVVNDVLTFGRMTNDPWMKAGPAVSTEL